MILLFTYSRITNGGKHAFVRADFGRNAMDGARGIERGTGAFVPMAAETDGTALAVVLNIIVTRTLSKAFAMANFRIGYLLASEED